MVSGNGQELPEDAVLVKQIGSLAFHFSKAEHAFFIQIEDYYAGSVKFSKPEIIELLNIFDRQSEEKEKELILDLEQDDDDF